MGSRLFI